MKVFFEKEHNKKKPKRWYLINEYGQVVCFPRRNYIKIASPFLKNGFIPSMEEFITDGYKRFYMYFYIKSHAEEARFIVWASGGVEIDHI